jgi:hypothetical protein
MHEDASPDGRERVHRLDVVGSLPDEIDAWIERKLRLRGEAEGVMELSRALAPQSLREQLGVDHLPRQQDLAVKLLRLRDLPEGLTELAAVDGPHLEEDEPEISHGLARRHARDHSVRDGDVRLRPSLSKELEGPAELPVEDVHEQMRQRPLGEKARGERARTIAGCGMGHEDGRSSGQLRRYKRYAQGLHGIKRGPGVEVDQK